MEKWYVAAKKADFGQIAKEFGISPVVARIIRNRDVENKEDIQKFLCGKKEDLYDPMLFKDMETGCALLWKAIAEKKHIRVIGDYDVDGICATHILCTGLKEAGAIVDTAIPHRMKDGYGLNEHLIYEAAADGIEVLVTCDNGIAAAEQIALAKELGMTVLVTDHHEVPFMEEDGVRHEILPLADGIINPKQTACSYPYQGICGALVALKVVQSLFRQKGTGEEQKILEQFLPFAALATVCDVMELLDENRIVVKEGLKMLRLSPNPGLLALMQVNGLEPARLNAYHLGFVLGPCMNAAGRLDTAGRALQLLACTDRSEAMRLASELKELNDSRKSMTAKGVEEAHRIIQEQELLQDRVLVVYLAACHESLAGIIAGRLREAYGRPVFVLTDSEEEVKGSGRSIDAYHMYEEMVKCKDCFLKFGGHRMAAGLSMEKENIPKLRRRLNEACCLTKEDMLRKVHIDVPMPLSCADRELASQMELLEPFGTGNPKPLFAQKDVVFVHGQKMGAAQKAARFTVADDAGRLKELVFFGNLDEFESLLTEKYGEAAPKELFSGKNCAYRVHITYQLGMNIYRGTERVQIIMQNFC